jgi:lipopolysaccharide/colanic/teichoic acid biosynthesis glycosyltransferase
LIIAGLLVLGCLKLIGGSLLGQQAKGSIPLYTVRRAKAAAELLPPPLRNRYLEEWLAELQALENRPLSAIRYASGLATAARVIAVSQGAPTTYSRRRVAFERLLDLIVSSVMIVWLLPMLVLLALCVWASTRGRGGSVLARRTEIGKGGVFFLRLRFSTTVWRDNGPDRQTTWIGEFLERSRSKELPVLINVLRGEMAIFGPPLESWPAEQAVPRVTPGLLSWEYLVRCGFIDLTRDEARIRDQRRRLRYDIQLVYRGLPAAAARPTRPLQAD